MKKIFHLLFFITPLFAMSQNPVMYWDFENIKNRNYIEAPTNISDTIEGNFEEATGVAGKGLRLDGFTTCVIRKGSDLKKVGSEFTIEAWVSLGEYPWNWCPVITTESDEVKGYRLMIGPLGQASFQAAIGEQWISCTSETETLQLRKWMHLTGVYQAGKQMTLYVNGEEASSVPIQGSMILPARTKCIIGMLAVPGKPSDIHRTWGTVDAYYGLDGIIDEIKVHGGAISAGEIKKIFLKFPGKAPDIPLRKLPGIESNPALIVKPPKGYEIGYVPIVIGQK